jgi:hypothetical protein
MREFASRPSAAARKNATALRTNPGAAIAGVLPVDARILVFAAPG